MSSEPSGGFHIFISYRRKGTDIHAGRLYDSLRKGEGDIPGFAAPAISRKVLKKFRGLTEDEIVWGGASASGGSEPIVIPPAAKSNSRGPCGR